MAAGDLRRVLLVDARHRGPPRLLVLDDEDLGAVLLGKGKRLLVGLALPAILATTVWQIFPFASVVLLAVLQGVSQEVQEAAQMDGADRISIFKVALLALFA